jgi:hypothetical protein
LFLSLFIFNLLSYLGLDQSLETGFLHSPRGLAGKKMIVLLIVSALGNKKDNITIVYTPWSNLKKDGSMAVGQVGFKDQRKACLQCRSISSWLLILI